MTEPVAPILEGARICLRPFELRDFDAFARLYASARSQYMDGPLSRGAAWAQFAAGAGRWQLTGYGAWTIERRTDSAAIGFVSLNHPVGDDERELGWALYAGFEGAGYASEAAELARRYAFDVLGWTQCVSYIDKGNLASIRLVERLGGVLDRDAAAPDGDRTRVYRHVRA